MRGKKVVKKIAALTAGLSMVGATIFGASAAADLADYPSPLFIKDGKFSGNIVVGASAAAEDVVGAIEIGTSLQFASVKKKVTSSATDDSFEVSDGFRIQRSGDPLVFGRYLQEVQDTALDSTDLPVMLKDGFFDDNEGTNDASTEYDQEIALTASNGQIKFHQDDNDAPVGQAYLFIDDNANVYTYTLDFDEDVDYDNTSAATTTGDVEDTEIEVMGQTYTIISAGAAASTFRLNELTMLAGETVVWLAKDEPVTRIVNGVEHEILLVGVNSNEDKCSLQIDDAVQIVEVGQTRSVNGVEVGVSDAIHSDTGLDNCKVNVGATKVRIKTGEEVKINDKDLDQSEGNMRLNGGAKWEGFNISIQLEDEVYLPAGESWVDPVFGQLMFTFGGLESKDVETTVFQASGDDGTLTFYNTDGKKIEIEYTVNAAETDIIAGDGEDIDERIYFEGDICDFTSGSGASGSITDCEGAKFLVITSGGEAHLMEIKDVDTSDDQIDIEDLTYGSKSDGLAFVDTTVGTKTLSLGSGAGSITLTLENSTGGTGGGTPARINFSEIDGSSGQTNPGSKSDGESYLRLFSTANIGTATSKRVLTFTEDSDDNVGGNAFSVNLSYSSSDNELQVLAPVATSGRFESSSVDFSDSNDDDKWYVTNWSTYVLHDAEDKHKLEIWYPKGYREALVYVSEVGASVSAGQSVAVTELQPIEVGAAKLDSEIDNAMAQDLIVVGGPCVNTVAAELMDNPADCAAGFEQGAAMLKLWEHSNGHVALLVAGYSALDTRRASRVLANYKDYSSNLKGSEVVVKGASLTDVRFESASTA